MLNFFIRFLIILFALVICAGFASSILEVSLILPIVFVCSWIFIKPFKNIVWEIVIFAVIYDFLLASHVGLYFLIILSFSWVFSFINYSVFEVSGKRAILAYFGVSLLTVILISFNFIFNVEKIKFIFLLKQIFSYIIISIICFFIFSKLINYLESIISFYSHKINVKRHI